jgi:hypothetical protein
MVLSKERLVIIMTIYYKKELDNVTDTYILGLIDGFFHYIAPYDD